MRSIINKQKRIVVSLRKKGIKIDDLQGKSDEEIMSLELPRKLKEDALKMIKSGSMWRYLDDKPAENDVALWNAIEEEGYIKVEPKSAPETEEELKKLNKGLVGCSEVTMVRNDLEKIVGMYDYQSIAKYIKKVKPILEGSIYDNELLLEVIKERIEIVKSNKS